jgi:hypothetical protein
VYAATRTSTRAKMRRWRILFLFLGWARAGARPLTSAHEWRTVHVYVGEGGQYDVPESVYPQLAGGEGEWRGQCQQDAAVARVLGGQRDGFFVDLGAHDALVFSNTVVLEQRYGWRGLCIEPVEAYHWGLAHRACQVVSAVVGDGTGAVEFDARLTPGAACPGCAGIVSPHTDNRAALHAADARRRPTVRLDTLLALFGAPRVIDYLSLDIEGAETDALRALFYADAYHVRVLTVERPNAKARALLREKGYRFVRALCPEHGDLLYAHRNETVAEDEFAVCGHWCAGP